MDSEVSDLDDIVSYQVTNFMPEIMIQICKLLKMELHTASGHPEENWRTESVHCNKVGMISHLVDNNHINWEMYLPYAVSAYNSKVHTSTKLSLYEGVYGKAMSTAIDYITAPIEINNIHVLELATKLQAV
ncbi:hypothetical protein PR048_013036 [Dryococelus australis]|uniref:Uncharacterized protein n=1 Tax=Dryococelus australis TaxID=614101 RepID=A0ABQ9HRV5_9NEOP|nr:hypothetical protein PR048_013036 [Dryococelus australis]